MLPSLKGMLAGDGNHLLLAMISVLLVAARAAPTIASRPWQSWASSLLIWHFIVSYIVEKPATPLLRLHQHVFFAGIGRP